MTASTQSQDGYPDCLEAVIKTCMKLTSAECTVEILMMAKKMPETRRVL